MSLEYDSVVTRYSPHLKEKVHRLRNQGKTYREIRSILQTRIPKSTLSEWCRNISLPSDYTDKVAQLNMGNLGKARIIALKKNKIKREEFFRKIQATNSPIASKIHNNQTAKIALAMLCLGEASKYNGKTAFYLGSSNPRIITLFLELLRRCFHFDTSKVRCTIQCRADQDPEELKKYWMDVTQVPKRLFYKPNIDPRTRGKPTRRSNYMGVLRINYLDTKVQLELESLAHLVYNEIQRARSLKG